jgi:hypothetical protein
MRHRWREPSAAWNECVLIIESEAVRRTASGFIAFHEKAFKLKMKLISFGWAALWDRASMRTRYGGPGLDPI